MEKKEKIIEQVINGKKRKSNILDNWFNYLENNLKYPFEANVQLFSYSKVMKTGDIVKVISLNDYNEEYGFIMNVKIDRKSVSAHFNKVKLRK